jgi:hypothetical protein
VETRADTLRVRAASTATHSRRKYASGLRHRANMRRVCVIADNPVTICCAAEGGTTHIFRLDEGKTVAHVPRLEMPSRGHADTELGKILWRGAECRTHAPGTNSSQSLPKCMILTITQTSKSNPVPIQNFPTHFRLPPTSTRDCAGGSSSPARSSIHGRCRKDGELCGVFRRRPPPGLGPAVGRCR